jgi:alpha-ribazole phosphatase/probable phosphoglycerate mutase
VVTINFEPHATSFDNEYHVASGHHDVDLSPLGEEQAKELGRRRAGEHFEAVFCSDLKRSYRTAELAFSRRFPIITDARLRECDYGSFTRRPKAEVDTEVPKRIVAPFPNGESYEQVTARMRSFLKDLLRNYDGKTVMIIGHRATQYGLDHWIKGMPLNEVLTAPWKWQPGWAYYLEDV